MILFDTSKVEARAATSAKERQEYGDMVLVVNSREQKRHKVKRVHRRRRASTRNLTQTPFLRSASVRHSQIVPLAENMVSGKRKAMTGRCVECGMVKTR